MARQRSAKPRTAVRIRFRPHRNRVVDIYNAVSVLLVCARQCDSMILSANDFPDESLIIKSEFFQRQVNLMNIKYRVMFVQSLVLFDI